VTERYVNGPVELRLGRWQDVLLDVTEVDSVITDPPYSPRTHEGRRTGSEVRQSAIGYAPLEIGDVQSFGYVWGERVREWIVVFGDDTSAQWWKTNLAPVLYPFAPIPWVKPDAAPRMSGDGPASAAEYIVAARRRVRLRRMGSRPGYYEYPTGSTRGNHERTGHPGAKPLELMRALIRDYSEPGDLICDPYAGSGTTLLATLAEGRRAVGAEQDPETFRRACERLAGLGPSLTRHGQLSLLVPA
jgi:site-specific DNA-methyltransferase (adenine-specific)